MNSITTAFRKQKERGGNEQSGLWSAWVSCLLRHRDGEPAPRGRTGPSLRAQKGAQSHRGGRCGLFSLLKVTVRQGGLPAPLGPWCEH